MSSIYHIIQIRRGTENQFNNYNPTLALGEPAYAVDTQTLKIGDGTNAWQDLQPINNTLSDLSVTSGNVDYLQFNTSTTDYEPLLGQINWNSDESTLDIGITENITQHVGQDLVYRVDNHTGGSIYKGQAVYASGVTSGGKRIRINKFAADGAMSEIRFMGLASENINHGELGFVQHFGYVKNIDLRTTNTNINPDAETWNEGDILYVHPSTAGGLTKTQPQESIVTALVLGTGNAGELFVRPTLYGHINDLHDVSINAPSSGDGLIYNGATSLWENVTVPKSDISQIFGNASGVYNIVVVDAATYGSISPKDPNTIYFVP